MSIPPAWHPDPTGRHDHRWWDGTRWTEHVADAGVSAVDPLDTSGGATDASATRDDVGSAADGAGGWTSPEGRTAGSGGDWTTRQTGAAQPAWQDTGAAGGWPEQPSGAPTSSDGMAIAAGIIGIVSIPAVLILIGGLSGVVAIVLGAIALSRIRRSGRGGRGMAITGLVTGIVSVVLVVLLLVVGFAMFREIGWGPFQSYAECMEEVGDDEICQERLEDDLPAWMREN